MPTHTHTRTRTFTHMHTVYLAARQQQTVLRKHRLSGERPGLNILRPLCFFGFFFLILCHVRNLRQPPPSPSLLEMERCMRWTAWGVDSRPGRGRGREDSEIWQKQKDLQNRGNQHRILQYCTFPVQMEGKIRQLWSILMRLNDLHAVFKVSEMLRPDSTAD